MFMISINFYYNNKERNFVPYMNVFSSLLICLVWFGCKSSNQANVLEAKEFNSRISGVNTQLVDVRTPEEYDEAHIANAVNINIKSADFEKNVDGLYKDVPVYVYCKSGNRSSDAASRLRAMGFKQVFDLKGGIIEWKAAGLPVVPSVPVLEKPDFKTAIQGEKLVLVDFNATWCGPCKMMQPFVDRMEKTRSEEVTVFSIDTDERTDLAQEYQITQLPTIMLFRKGKVLEKSIGYLDEETLNALVNKHL
jgi:thioredoxin 1